MTAKKSWKHGEYGSIEYLLFRLGHFLLLLPVIWLNMFYCDITYLFGLALKFMGKYCHTISYMWWKVFFLSVSISRVADQNGVYLLYIMLEICHSGWEPSISLLFVNCYHYGRGSHSLEMNLVTVYDINNKFIAYTAPYPEVIDIMCEAGAIYILSGDRKVCVCVWVCLFLSVCCVCVCVCVCICACVCMCVCACVLCVCVCVCVWVSKYVCVCVCVCVCVLASV